MNSNNIELVFDVLDQSATHLFETQQTPYLKGVVLTCENILAHEIILDTSDETDKVLLDLLHKMDNIDFQKEEIRKAIQLCILKGFKLSKQSNQEITPDTIGIFLSYLIKKLIDFEGPMTLFDPLVGTGNLICTVANNLDKETLLFGVDHNLDQVELSKAMFEMMDYGEEVYFQDTLTFWNLASDVLLCDFSNSETEDEMTYFPYEVIKHHLYNLKPGGFFLGIIYNDFFEQPTNEEFRKYLLESWEILGLIKLPDSIFKSLGKSILILEKKSNIEYVDKQFLLADIPSFEDEEAFQKAIYQINLWFKNRKKV
ncbi:MAG: N-6 DNA methylase [Candidatus Izemoplasmatales bacterium]|jgi:site-specific DNA-methyltransferase (adenine-specific)|nr:N-6 DNA methylase [Candidatus Izemoplasmatales bacterium]